MLDIEKENYLNELKSWNLIKTERDLRFFIVAYRRSEEYFSDSDQDHFSSILDECNSERDFKKKIKQLKGKKKRIGFAVLYMGVRKLFESKILNCPDKAGLNCLASNEKCSFLNCKHGKGISKNLDWVKKEGRGILITEGDTTERERDELLKFTDAIPNSKPIRKW